LNSYKSPGKTESKRLLEYSSATNTFVNKSSPEAEHFTTQKENQILLDCLYGEYLSITEEGKGFSFCQKCNNNTYSEQDTGLHQFCYPCPEGLTCLGGYSQLALNQDYWQDKFMESAEP